MASYPGALPSFVNPSGTDYLNSPAHATQHSTNNDETVAIATKVGTGASTPVADTYLKGTAAGVSAWTGLTINRAFSWYISGTLTTGTNFGARYVAPEAMTITKVWLIVRTAPTGAAILIDINKNGSTIWATQGNRGTIAAAATTGNTTTFDTTALTAGDYLDLDLDQVGSTVAGVDLTVILETTQP
jgi:hypothetical protein